jgi:hypothetical protein
MAHAARSDQSLANALVAICSNVVVELDGEYHPRKVARSPFTAR